MQQIQDEICKEQNVTSNKVLEANSRRKKKNE